MESLNSNSKERELYQLQQMQHKAKESCMKSFRLLQSHLQVLSYNDLKINGCIERAFATLFEQDVQTFTGIMLLNLDQLEKQLDKDEFQGDRSMAAFCVINKQFQMFIDSQLTWDYDSQMTEKYFAEYTGIEVKQFRETLLLHMGNVKKSLAEKTRHKRHGTKSDKHDKSSSSGTYITHAVDADIRPVNDQVPFAEVQLTAQHNVLANEQQHTEQFEPIYDTYLLEKDAPEFREFFEINDLKAQLQAKTTLICNLKNQIKSVKDASNEAKVKHEIDVLETINIELESSVAKLLAENEKLNKENEHLKQTYKELYDSIKKTRIQTKDHNDSLIAQVNSKTVENADLKAQIQEKVFANVALKNELRKLKGNSVDTKFAKPSILGKPVLQPPRNQSVVRQPRIYLLPLDDGKGIQSPKTRNNNKPVEPKSHTQKPGRQIAIGQRWIPTGKMFTDNTTKVDSQLLNGSNDNITNPYECNQTLNVSAVLDSYTQTSFSTPNLPPTKNDWGSLFCPMFDEYFNPSPSVVQPVLVAVVQEPVVSTSTSQTTQEEQSHVIPTSVKEDDHAIEVAHMDNDLPISTRLQLQTEALFCYYDALLSSTEHKSYKDALTESVVIDAMKRLHKFEILEDLEASNLVPKSCDAFSLNFQLADIFKPLGKKKLNFHENVGCKACLRKREQC
ncbi:hypothetical protein Tco_0269870 [Tanacetum coccineum]